jgi:hypothetical protein
MDHLLPSSFLACFSFPFMLSRQKGLKALNDRLKLKETVSEAWPDLDDASSSALPPSTPHVDHTSVTIDMNPSDSISAKSTNGDDSNHQLTTA